MRVMPYLLQTSGRRQAGPALPVASIQELRQETKNSFERAGFDRSRRTCPARSAVNYFSMFGARRLTFLMMLRPLHGLHFGQQRLRAARTIATQMALAALGAHQFAASGQAEALGQWPCGSSACTCRFSLCVARRSRSFQNEMPPRAGTLRPAGANNRCVSVAGRVCCSRAAGRPAYDWGFASVAAAVGVSALSFFLGEAFPGATTTCIVRPSIIGACSIVPRSASDCAISFKSSRAISG